MSMSLTPLIVGLLVLMRFVGYLVACPLFGFETVSWRVRLALAMSLAFLVTSNLTLPKVVPDSLVMLGLLGACELLVGLAVSLILSFFVHGVRMAGQLAGIQMGLGFATMVDPLTGDSASVLARILGLTSVLVALCFGGHHILLKGLCLSFVHLPPGQAFMSLLTAVWAVPQAAITLFFTAALVASPVLATVFCIKVAMAIMARAAPQVHVLTIGFIITIVVGVFALAWSLPSLGVFLRSGFEQAAMQALQVITVS